MTKVLAERARFDARFDVFFLGAATLNLIVIVHRLFLVAVQITDAQLLRLE